MWSVRVMYGSRIFEILGSRSVFFFQVSIAIFNFILRVVGLKTVFFELLHAKPCRTI